MISAGKNAIMIYNFVVAITRKLRMVRAIFLGLKSPCTRNRKLLYVSHPNPARHTVSLNIPEPQINTLGIKRMAIAIGRV